MSVAMRSEDRLETWERPWNGVHWYDMPGDDSDDQKLNFALWRMGRKEYAMDEERGELREICPQFGRIAGMGGRARHDTMRAVEMRGDRLNGLKVRLRALIDQGWTIREMAAEKGMDATVMSRTLNRAKSVSEETLQRLRDVIVCFEARERKVEDAEVKPAVPEGCVPFKEWLGMEAARFGLSRAALYGRLHRGVMPMPEMVMLNARRFFVRVAASGEQTTDAAQRVPTEEAHARA